MKITIKLAAILILAAAAFSLAGCASYKIQPVAAAELKQWKETKLPAGYVFYQSELYFLVTSTPPKASGDTSSTKADSGVTFSVTPIYLPNPNKPYRVTTFNFFAKSDFAFSFKDGWQLTSIADKADNTGATTALVGQMKTMLDAATVIASEKPLPQTFLLHPEFDAAGIITNFAKILVPSF